MKSDYLRQKPTVRRQQRGVAAIEFALVFSVLFLGIYGLVTFCGVLYVQQVISRAAEDGARAAQLSRIDEMEANARTAIYRSLALSMITPGATPSLREVWLRTHMTSPEVRLPPGGVEVKVTYPYRAHPLLPPLPLTESWMPVALLGKATATIPSS